MLFVFWFSLFPPLLQDKVTGSPVRRTIRQDSVGGAAQARPAYGALQGRAVGNPREKVNGEGQIREVWGGVGDAVVPC